MGLRLVGSDVPDDTIHPADLDFGQIAVVTYWPPVPKRSHVGHHVQLQRGGGGDFILANLDLGLFWGDPRYLPEECRVRRLQPGRYTFEVF